MPEYAREVLCARRKPDASGTRSPAPPTRHRPRRRILNPCRHRQQRARDHHDLRTHAQRDEGHDARQSVSALDRLPHGASARRVAIGDQDDDHQQADECEQPPRDSGTAAYCGGLSLYRWASPVIDTPTMRRERISDEQYRYVPKSSTSSGSLARTETSDVVACDAATKGSSRRHGRANPSVSSWPM